MLLQDFKNTNDLWVASKRVGGVQFLTVSGSSWKGIINRCKHGGAEHARHPSYIGATNEFGSFDSFTSWSVKQVGYNCGWDLDKDVLRRQNKVYSEETCVFVPKAINSFLTNRKVRRGAYPVGVSFHSRDMQYTANCNNGAGKLVHLGNFDCQNLAFLAYKKYKEVLAKTLASKWSGQVDLRVVAALNAYEVEVID